MTCPICGHKEDKVSDSRESKEGDSVRRRRQTGVEDERPGGIDQVVTHGRRCQHRAALAAQRLGQRGRHHHDAEESDDSERGGRAPHAEHLRRLASSKQL